MIDFIQRITINPNVRSGKPCIRNTRVTVYDILEYLAGGMSEEEILSDFPSLSHDDIQAVFAFATAREHVSINPKVMGGKPCIRGIRVTVGTITGLLSAGKTQEDILKLYPDLEKEDIYSALSYQYGN